MTHLNILMVIIYKMICIHKLRVHAYNLSLLTAIIACLSMFFTISVIYKYNTYKNI